MNLELIDRIIKGSIISAIFFFFLVNFEYGLKDGLSFLIGMGWGCINLLCLKHLIKNILLSGERSLFKIALTMTLKFPALYFIGYLLLSSDYFSMISLTLGSLLIFGVMFFLILKGFFVRATLCIAATFFAPQLHASLKDVPEVPNLVTFIYKAFHEHDWAIFLHRWENIFFSILIGTVVSLIFFVAARKKALVPQGIQNFVEYLVEILRDFVVNILGPSGDKYLPFLGTLFIYILSMNLVTVIPFMKPPTSSINVTIALAIVVFIYIQYLNIKNWGFWGFMYHLLGSPKTAVEWMVVPLMFPIEVLTQLTRPVTLALRLFGNIAGEDILIGAASLFGVFLLSSLSLIGGLPMQIPFFFLALLTGLMQALVFTLLSTIYILLSMPHHEKEKEK